MLSHITSEEYVIQHYTTNYESFLITDSLSYSNTIDSAIINQDNLKTTTALVSCPLKYNIDTTQTSYAYITNIMLTIIVILFSFRLIALYITYKQSDEIIRKNYTRRSTDTRRYIDFRINSTKPILKIISKWNSNIAHSSKVKDIDLIRE